jgi:hypothetical protein
MTRALAALLGIALVGGASAALAGDGVIEINQASIQAAGGFPFVASNGSFKLTSNLTVPDGNTTAIQASNATIDLNGFVVAGPAVCTATPYDASTMSCTNAGNGVGVSAGAYVTIRNGRITGFGNQGISANSSYYGGATIEDVIVDGNAQGGIDLYQGVLRNSQVLGNGGHGITNCYCGAAGLNTVIENNVISFNKLAGINVGALIADNRIDYNGGPGVQHGNAGGTHSRINGNQFHRNKGVAIDAFGSYWGNEIYSNGTYGGSQVIGGMFDAGNNRIN